jgi:hypothetical protein
MFPAPEVFRGYTVTCSQPQKYSGDTLSHVPSPWNIQGIHYRMYPAPGVWYSVTFLPENTPLEDTPHGPCRTHPIAPVGHTPWPLQDTLPEPSGTHPWPLVDRSPEQSVISPAPYGGHVVTCPLLLPRWSLTWHYSSPGPLWSDTLKRPRPLEGIR